MGMQADYIGVSSTLTDATGVPAVGWVALLFGVELLIPAARVDRRDRDVGARRRRGEHRADPGDLRARVRARRRRRTSRTSRCRSPATTGFDRSSLALVFGVTFTAYFGHLSVSNCARVVLGARPGRAHARARRRGRAADRDRPLRAVRRRGDGRGRAGHARRRGRARRCRRWPTRPGPLVLALGGVLVVLGMGMASIHSALALFYLVRERLPSRAPLTLVLPRRGARIVLSSARPRRARRASALTYVGARSRRAARCVRHRRRRQAARDARARRGDGAGRRGVGAVRRGAAARAAASAGCSSRRRARRPPTTSCAARAVDARCGCATRASGTAPA